LFSGLEVPNGLIVAITIVRPANLYLKVLKAVMIIRVLRIWW